MQGSIKEKHEPNLDQVINNIQIEHVVSIEPVVSTTESVAITIKSFQLVQPVVKPIQIENPQFSRFQLVLVSNHP
jgi:hypothetical protein